MEQRLYRSLALEVGMQFCSCFVQDQFASLKFCIGKKSQIVLNQLNSFLKKNLFSFPPFF